MIIIYSLVFAFISLLFKKTIIIYKNMVLFMVLSFSILYSHLSLTVPSNITFHGQIIFVFYFTALVLQIILHVYKFDSKVYFLHRLYFAFFLLSLLPYFINMNIFYGTSDISSFIYFIILIVLGIFIHYQMPKTIENYTGITRYRSYVFSSIFYTAYLIFGTYTNWTIPQQIYLTIFFVVYTVTLVSTSTQK
jgi:hypothetical protein